MRRIDLSPVTEYLPKHTHTYLKRIMITVLYAYTFGFWPFIYLTKTLGQIKQLWNKLILDKYKNSYNNTAKTPGFTLLKFLSCTHMLKCFSFSKNHFAIHAARGSFCNMWVKYSEQ